MGRLVQAPRRVQVRATGGGLESTGGQAEVNVGGDSYPDRVAKYIPGEVIAGYMALDRNLVPSPDAFREKVQQLNEKAGALVAKSGGAGDPGALALQFHSNLPLFILAIGLIFTPVYIYNLARQSGPGTPWITHACVATMAFLVWAYAIQGSAFTVGQGALLYDGSWASAAVVLFTLFSGAFAPGGVPANGATPAASGGGRQL